MSLIPALTRLMLQLIRQSIASLVIVMACAVSAALADTSYTPPPASGGPYPAASSTAAPAPYAPSGWKPSGRQFLLPARQKTSVSYLPPSYLPPKSTTPAETETPITEGTTFKPEVSS